MKHSFFARWMDLLAPRTCLCCGRRLAVGEEDLCTSCNLDLDRTDFALHPYDNDMARTFWGRVPSIEKACALMYYHARSRSADLIYQIKYGHRPELAVRLGERMGRELSDCGFFEGIDMIVPVPLAKKRERERGYNQCERLAHGLGRVTGLPVATRAVERTVFQQTQTRLTDTERLANVEHAFRLVHPEPLCGRHILLLDDVVTTGATMSACASVLSPVPGLRISLCCVGFVNRKR